MKPPEIDSPFHPDAKEPRQHKPQAAGELVRSDVAIFTAIGKDVARLADAAEAMLALYRSEIERTRR